MPSVWANITPPWIVFAYPSEESDSCDIGEILDIFMHKEDAERFAAWYPLMNGRTWSIQQYGIRQSWSPDTEGLTRYIFTTYPHRIHSIPDNEDLRELEIDIVTDGIGATDHARIPDLIFAWLYKPKPHDIQSPCLFFRIFAPDRQQATLAYAHHLRTIHERGAILNLYDNDFRITGSIHWPGYRRPYIIRWREEESHDTNES